MTGLETSHKWASGRGPGTGTGIGSPKGSDLGPGLSPVSSVGLSLNDVHVYALRCKRRTNAQTFKVVASATSEPAETPAGKAETTGTRGESNRGKGLGAC